MSTEERNPQSMDLDLMSSLDIVRVMNAQDTHAVAVVGGACEQIAGAADRIAVRMARGGRLIYIGAGTSGRLGVLDASECPPTFGVAPDRVIGVLAGGDYALRHSVEGAEDDRNRGRAEIAELAAGPDDSVVGIAASGHTPYTIAAIEEARARGAFTVSIACNHPSPLADAAEWPIPLVVGPEVLTGSTRLKAGTAQKMALNMLSTVVMVRLGYVYGNLMAGVQPTNEKLRGRAVRIVQMATGANAATAHGWLSAAGWHVRVALVMGLAGVDADTAAARLEAAGGHVRRAVG
ncbi:MAG: N-acetylmuramic acid 6-phosphate etherase [Anaerolineae bacterium]|nr:N-acetylmuramic acid 6-phosphate etherase [Anaerolineae bacterium]